MNRRSFFNRLLGAAAIVALAPQLCFRVLPKLPRSPQQQFVEAFFFNKPVDQNSNHENLNTIEAIYPPVICNICGWEPGDGVMDLGRNPGTTCRSFGCFGTMIIKI